ncbi:hypothetical protein MTBBW1_1220008 [Desulfamplus magnetovallimortis]|uniref:Response regulatory domain-containing protein n=1 Tax=Desulfamplus magnetovallimortis TaxID=1246637 RepID=A0A1W1H6K6_9BACT|nr:response regulator [Desulfamplus magnetovallimortis]SLM28008.1 hypothetical protein MTBBW1_1220008 [Desulfamplus magnetovallimortis]
MKNQGGEKMKFDHKVLIVDDDIQVGNVLAAILKQIGVSSVYASNGVEALSKIEKMRSTFSLVITDQRMPGMKGTELLERISQISPDTVRFLTTGYADINAVVEAVNRGRIHKYISKPWQTEQLFEDLKAGLKQYELLVESENLFRIAKEQNARLYALNKDLKQSAARQTKILAELEEEIAHEKIKMELTSTSEEGCLINDPASPSKKTVKDKRLESGKFSDFDSQTAIEEIKKKILMVDGMDEKKATLIFEEAVKKIFADFQKIALQRGFEFLLTSQ